MKLAQEVTGVRDEINELGIESPVGLFFAFVLNNLLLFGFLNVIRKRSHLTL